MNRLLMICLCLACALATGCNRVAKVDNPVAPEPPPRVSWDDGNARPETADNQRLAMQVGDGSPHSAEEIPTHDSQMSVGDETEFLRTAASVRTGTEHLPDPGTATGTVVVVNGQPIFAEDVLHDFEVRVRAAKEKLSPDDFQRAQPEIHEARAEFLRKALPMHIEGKLLSTALMRTLDEKQKEGLKVGLKEAFEAEMSKKQKELGAQSRGELEVILAKSGWTLPQWRKAFEERQLAQLYVSQNAGTPPVFSRNELLEYYQQHLDDYAVAGKVKWRQIVIDFESRGGEPVARRDVNEVVQKLISGGDFAELAREYSDGATAEQGGLWDWTEQGSLADENLEAILFQIRPGSVSDVVKSDTSYQLVQVVERIDPGHVPFPDVHDEIAKSLREERYQAAAQGLVKELKQTAVLEWKYDLGDVFERD